MNRVQEGRPVKHTPAPSVSRGRALQHVVPVSHLIFQSLLEAGDVVVDATVGNGSDTLLLAHCVAETGKVYGFDVQAAALEKTREKLVSSGLETPVVLHLAGHENLLAYVNEPVQAVIFNLGYLPGADKSLHTRWETTQTAIEAAMSLLKPGGFIALTAYPGTPGGLAETEALEAFLHRLEDAQFSAATYKMLNQVNQPPILYVIQKREGSKR